MIKIAPMRQEETNIDDVYMATIVSDVDECISEVNAKQKSATLYTHTQHMLRSAQIIVLACNRDRRKTMRGNC